MLKEKYLKHYKNDIGRKFEIGKTVYTLKKEGLVYRGQIFHDFIDSIELFGKIRETMNT